MSVVKKYFLSSYLKAKKLFKFLKGSLLVQVCIIVSWLMWWHWVTNLPLRNCEHLLENFRAALNWRVFWTKYIYRKNSHFKFSMSCFEQENVKLISSLSDFLLLSLSSSILSEPFLCCRKLKLESLCKSGRRTTADFNGV